MSDTTASIAVLAIIGLITVWCILQSIEKNKVLVEKGLKPFKWGYYFGCLNIFGSIWIACIAFDGRLRDESDIFLLGLSIIQFSSTLRLRSKMGFILATVSSLNPIFWIINYFYGSKRFEEFRALRFSGKLGETDFMVASTLASAMLFYFIGIHGSLSNRESEQMWLWFFVLPGLYLAIRLLIHHAHLANVLDSGRKALSGRVECEVCRELIKKGASKCRFCGHLLKNDDANL